MLDEKDQSKAIRWALDEELIKRKIEYLEPADRKANATTRRCTELKRAVVFQVRGHLRFRRDHASRVLRGALPRSR